MLRMMRDLVIAAATNCLMGSPSVALDARGCVPRRSVWRPRFVMRKTHTPRT
ncbi:MAG: hypothetical protein LC790_20530 [Actinobacteria bacterium]|nr:hypothetical protein [Actinomycetota bacterium]